MENFEENNINSLLSGNLLPLAFLGDSVHTLYVRQNMLKKFQSLGNLSSHSAKLCKASAQAQALKKIMPLLTDEEAEIVRRARNSKSKHTAKNASVADYSYATAFEALIGYLFLTKQTERLEKMLQISCEIEEKDAN